MRVNEWKNKRVLCAIVNECQKKLENDGESEREVKRRRHTKEYEAKNVSKRPNTRHSEYKFFLFVSLCPFATVEH